MKIKKEKYMKNLANKWESKPAANIPTGKKFKVGYFHSYTDEQFFKVVRAKDKEEALAKFQEAVRWDFDRVGKIVEL